MVATSKYHPVIFYQLLNTMISFITMPSNILVILFTCYKVKTLQPPPHAYM